jgi:hypothetical protein
MFPWLAGDGWTQPDLVRTQWIEALTVCAGQGLDVLLVAGRGCEPL